MSRQINQPVQSIKLTNVATVRLTVQGKRFEVACYKNKVLDYRAGLETDLSEVLQSPHIFTSVAQGQFAAASDLQTCFGDGMDMEQIAIQILQRGKSLQVGAAERAQQYEQTLAQIATWLATNCHHPVTGKPYTVSQIRHALTTTSRAVSGSAAGGSETNEGGSANHANTKNNNNANKGGKKKKHNNKKQPASDDTEQQPQQNHHAQQSSFTVQPHKPIKQQYLAAFKYLQNVQQLPIQRAAMRLQWEYPVDQHDAVTKALTELHITSSAVIEHPHPDKDNNDTTTILLTVDPSLYRPLHEVATNTGSNLEIVQQQVFPSASSSSSSQQQSRTAAAAAVENNTTATKTTAAPCSDTNGNVEAVPSNPDMNGTEEEEEEEDSEEEDDDEDHPAAPSDSNSSSSSSSDDEARQRQTMRPNQRQIKKKKQQKKQAQRRQQQQQLGSSSSSSSSDGDEDAPPAGSHMPPILQQQQLQHRPSNDTTSTTAALPQTNVTVQTCNTCVGEANAFATPAAYRAHFRSDWHRYNQKLKLQGAKAISLQEFEQCDAEAFFASLDRD